MSATSDVLRPVGMLEKLYTARQVLGIYNSVIVTATYTVASKLENTKLYSIICATIPRLLQRHPSLCCYFEREDTSKPRFRRLVTLEVKDILKIVDLEKRESLALRLQELHDQKWSVERKPLWKLVAMREPQIAGDAQVGHQIHIAFVYHHVIGDGLSGAAFHTSFLQELRNIEQISLDIEKAPKTINIPVFADLIEPVEKLTVLPLSWLYLIRQVVQEYGPRWFIGAPQALWTGLPTQTLDNCPFHSRIQIVTIEGVEVGILLEEGKKHGVTLNSLLTAAVVSALADALPDAPKFVGITPYTLRRVTGTSMYDMVNQTSGFETSYPADVLDRIRKASDTEELVDSFWNIASYFHAQMQDELARCPRDVPVGLLPYVSDYIKYYEKKIGKAREASFELSNLGVFKTTEEAPPRSWTLETMTFTQGAQPVGPAFNVNCVSVQGGPLTITITWQDSVVDEAVIDARHRCSGRILQRITPSSAIPMS